MTHHHHDDHYAGVIHDSYQRPRTTAEVADRVTEVIAEFEHDKEWVHRQLRLISIIAVTALGAALAAVTAWAVLR